MRYEPSGARRVAPDPRASLPTLQPQGSRRVSKIDSRHLVDPELLPILEAFHNDVANFIKATEAGK